MNTDPILFDCHNLVRGMKVTEPYTNRTVILLRPLADGQRLPGGIVAQNFRRNKWWVNSIDEDGNPCVQTELWCFDLIMPSPPWRFEFPTIEIDILKAT